MAEKRASLLDDTGPSTKGGSSKGKSKGGGMGGDKIKLLVAVAILAAAGAVYLFTSGILGESGPKYEPPTQEQVQAAQEQQKATQEAIKSGRAVGGGSD